MKVGRSTQSWLLCTGPSINWSHVAASISGVLLGIQQDSELSRDLICVLSVTTSRRRIMWNNEIVSSAFFFKKVWRAKHNISLMFINSASVHRLLCGFQLCCDAMPASARRGRGTSLSWTGIFISVFPLMQYVWCTSAAFLQSFRLRGV